MSEQLKVMLQCTHCGTLNDTTENACITCGTKLGLHGKSVLVNEANGIVDGRKPINNPLPHDTLVTPIHQPIIPQPGPEPISKPSPVPWTVPEPTTDTPENKVKNPLMSLCSILFAQCALTLFGIMYGVAAYSEIIPTEVSDWLNILIFVPVVILYLTCIFMSLLKAFKIRNKTGALITYIVLSIVMLVGVIAVLIGSFDFFF